MVAEATWKEIESKLSGPPLSLTCIIGLLIQHFDCLPKFDSGFSILHVKSGTGWLLSNCFGHSDRRSSMDVSKFLLFCVWKSFFEQMNGFSFVFNNSFAFEPRLHFIFGKNFERATRIVDQRGVKKISGEPSGRSIFQV